MTVDTRYWSETGLECSECDWRGCEELTEQKDFDDEPNGWACPSCGEPCAHTPTDEVENGAKDE